MFEYWWNCMGYQHLTSSSLYVAYFYWTSGVSTHRFINTLSTRYLTKYCVNAWFQWLKLGLVPILGWRSFLTSSVVTRDWCRTWLCSLQLYELSKCTAADQLLLRVYHCHRSIPARLETLNVMMLELWILKPAAEVSSSFYVYVQYHYYHAWYKTISNHLQYTWNSFVTSVFCTIIDDKRKFD